MPPQRQDVGFKFSVSYRPGKVTIIIYPDNRNFLNLLAANDKAVNFTS